MSFSFYHVIGKCFCHHNTNFFHFQLHSNAINIFIAVVAVVVVVAHKLFVDLHVNSLLCEFYFQLLRFSLLSLRFNGNKNSKVSLRQMTLLLPFYFMMRFEALLGGVFLCVCM